MKRQSSFRFSNTFHLGDCLPILRIFIALALTHFMRYVPVHIVGAFYYGVAPVDSYRWYEGGEGGGEKGVIYLIPWWNWRPAWPVARLRRSWSPPFVSWMCDVSWADYGYPGNGPGRWSTCALYSPNMRARRMSRIRCTTPRRTANTLEIRKDEKLRCQIEAKRGRVTCYSIPILICLLSGKIEELRNCHTPVFLDKGDYVTYKKDDNFGCIFYI